MSDIPLTVLDLPQLYTRPSTDDLLSILDQLASASPRSHTSAIPSIDESGIPSYLTRIISSPLTWIDADADKERIWEAASQRLSERSGRTGMGTITRTFTIHRPPRPETSNETPNPIPHPDSLEIKLNEPSLTGDNLGHKTWAASYTLARLLPTLLPKYFPSLLSASSSTAPAAATPLSILELGAGTGLTGLTASAIFPGTAHVHMTDLPPIVPNLQANIALNTAVLPSPLPTAAVLDWSTLPLSSSSDLKNSLSPTRDVDGGSSIGPTARKIDIILAADSLYASEHAAWLANAIACYLAPGERGKVFVSLPFREMGKWDYHEMLRAGMAAKGFVVLEESVEKGWDDWGSQGHREWGLERSGEDRDKGDVDCWISVWGWASK